jgi:disulfide bond formation protein DsbB
MVAAMLNRTCPAPLRFAAALAVLAGFGALAGALVAQYGFGLRPCVLCLVQRVPFGLAGLLGLAALLPATSGRRRLLAALAGIALLINSGIAVYHVGVERHWWASPGCSAQGVQAPMSVADLARMASQPAEVPCDKPAWAWHGLTLAGINVFYSGLVGLVILLFCRRNSRFRPGGN